MINFPSKINIQNTEKRITGYVHRTPILTSTLINKIVSSNLFFKCENFQKAGAFKFRGAVNTVLSLNRNELKSGVATHSSGNHAAALALAAKIRNAKAYIVMPRTAPVIKIKAVKSYGAEIIFCEPTLTAREKTLESIVKKTGAAFVHPYNDLRVIAGQATSAKELLEETPTLDYVIAPVGGGGLLSGTALSSNYFSKETKIIGAEPKGADDAFRSFSEGIIIPSVNPRTIADGLLTSLGDKTFPIIKKYVSEIITVEENSIIQAMLMIWERMKIIVEPSSAVPLASVLENRNKFADKNIGIILSGGNVDLENLPWN